MIGVRVTHLISILSFHHLLGLHHLSGRDRRCQSLRDDNTFIHEPRLHLHISTMNTSSEEKDKERLTSAFRSDRILTIHLFTVIWKVKLMTPLIFSSTSSQRLLRLYRQHKVKVIYFTFNLEGEHQGALKRND